MLPDEPEAAAAVPVIVRVTTYCPSVSPDVTSVSVSLEAPVIMVCCEGAVGSATPCVLVRLVVEGVSLVSLEVVGE